MLDLIALWSHLLAAVLYGALALLQLRHWNGDPRNRPLVSAFAVTVGLGDLPRFARPPCDGCTQLAESGRNLAFLAFMYGIVQSGDGERQPARGQGRLRRRRGGDRPADRRRRRHPPNSAMCRSPTRP